METTEEVMYVITLAYPVHDSDTGNFDHTNIFSVYCGDNYGVDSDYADIRFIYDDGFGLEIPLSTYKQLYKKLIEENDDLVWSSFNRVLITKKISKDGTIRYHDCEGRLLHKEKQKLLECNIEDILDKVMNYENNR